MPVSRVSPESLDAVWLHLLPQIRKALDSGQGDGASGDALRLSVYTGESEMWVVHEGEDITAGIVLSKLQGETGLKLFVELLAGDRMSEWVDEVQQKLVEYRDLLGANCIEASCRPGLAKRLMERGWKRKAIVVSI